MFVLSFAIPFVPGTFIFFLFPQSGGVTTDIVMSLISVGTLSFVIRVAASEALRHRNRLTVTSEAVTFLRELNDDPSLAEKIADVDLQVQALEMSALRALSAMAAGGAPGPEGCPAAAGDRGDGRGVPGRAGHGPGTCIGAEVIPGEAALDCRLSGLGLMTAVCPACFIAARRSPVP